MPSPKHLPFGLDLPGMIEWVYRIILALLVLASFYLSTVYAKKADVEEVERAIHKEYAELPEEVHTTTANLRAHIQSDAETSKNLIEIQRDLASVRATQRESMKNTEANFNRLFNKLDALPAR